MVTKESLQKTYSKLSTVELLEITAQRKNFTNLAVAAALEELKTRGIDDNEIRNYKSVFPVGPRETLLKNYQTDLQLWQKLAFYFLFLPKLRNLFDTGFYVDKYVLKQQQSNYYSILSFIIFVVSFVTETYHHNAMPVWCFGFAVCYTCDILFNKDKQIQQIQKKIAEDKNVWF